jgi:hypothetical protein
MKNGDLWKPMGGVMIRVFSNKNGTDVPPSFLQNPNFLMSAAPSVLANNIINPLSERDAKNEPAVPMKVTPSMSIKTSAPISSTVSTAMILTSTIFQFPETPTPNTGQMPYYAAIFVNDSFACGGAILHHKWIITAAHCGLKGDVSQFKV